MRRILFATMVVAAACGGGDDSPGDDGAADDGALPPDASHASDPDAGAPADADTRDLLVRLNDLPGVTATESGCRYNPSPTARCIELSITQPVDHDNPAGPTFQQDVTLSSEDLAAPMIAFTTGYDNYWFDYPAEPTQLLHANQLSIEYRFFGTSRPSPADWTKLTIAQAAADEHHVIELLKPIYTGAWLTSGGSKGGMTASYHARFWPGDVAGTVPYVAPLTFGLADPRYADFLDTDGTPACRQALRDLEVELLKDTRFNAILQRATTEQNQQGLAYTRVALGAAVEGAITGIEWAFWQYHGVSECGSVPPVTASDAAMFGFLQNVSAPHDLADDAIGEFEAYYYQVANELGGQDAGGDYTMGLTRYTAADYDGLFPAGVATPAFHPEAMTDIDQWVQTAGQHLLFIYGQFDPYTAGHYTLGAATDSALLYVPQGTHNDGIGQLGATDRATALAKLAAWSGVTPDESVFNVGALARRRLLPAPHARHRVPHLPIVVQRALAR